MITNNFFLRLNTIFKHGEFHQSQVFSTYSPPRLACKALIWSLGGLNNQLLEICKYIKVSVHVLPRVGFVIPSVRRLSGSGPNSTFLRDARVADSQSSVGPPSLPEGHLRSQHLQTCLDNIPQFLREVLRHLLRYAG